MPTNRAAVRHGSWGKARRAEYAFLREWDGRRPKRRPPYFEADEIYRGKKQKFYTVLSDLVHVEVIGLAKDRSEATIKALLRRARGSNGRPHGRSSRDLKSTKDDTKVV